MIYLLAIGAGLAMNFMPCVLPVVGLKLRAFSNPVKKVPYIAGVWVSFMLLATLAWATGAGLSHMSYGFFRAGLAAVCFLMGTKLVGLWEWNLRVPGVFGEFYGPFGTGLMTVALGSSCSVPFLAPALAYCTSAGALATYEIFSCMSFGFVFPFLIPIPMPRPGKWMARFEKGCGVALVVVGVWLCWTLQLELWVGAASFAATVVAVISIINRKYFTSSATVAIFLFIAICGVMFQQSEAMKKALTIPISGNRAIIVTADWCVNCPIAHRAWEDPEVKGLLKAWKIEPVTLDWTDRDPRVTAFLAEHNHQSVPFALIEVDGRVAVLSGIYSSSDLKKLLKLVIEL